MKNNFDLKTELIKIFDDLNRIGQEKIMDYANILRYTDKYKKNVIEVNFERDNDQNRNGTNNPTSAPFHFR
ncbi:MAG: hypothetical protein NC084_10210 [Bacteroides sp.]|nr:hypothetical protein [Eubacterium sp.]MCM1419175.1 hypothetical protein [Roseburia sp.]MCM1463072.1 hypothetical protein [Bacteroides sp.]